MKLFKADGIEHHSQKLELRNKHTKLIILSIITAILLILALLGIIQGTGVFIIYMLMLTVGLIFTLFFGFKGFFVSLALILLTVYLYIQEFLIPENEINLFLYLILLNTVIANFLIAGNISREKKKLSKLKESEILDRVTGAYNYTHFTHRLDEEIARANRNKTKLAMFLIDIDKFKQFNEKIGYREGDEMLHKTANHLKKAVRIQDTIFRYGGDEFAILLPDVNGEVAELVAERITSSFIDDRISLSLGYSILPDKAKTRDELVTQADNALYHAKNTGRNKATGFSDIFKSIKQYLDYDKSEFLDSLRALLCTIASKDRYTYGHSERVSLYSTKIGEALGLMQILLHY
jgi:diguanylate cyclase (GGDEF)-like protein